MFDDSDGDDSGSEFFGHRRKRSSSIGSSSGSESDLEDGGGLLARQLAEQERNKTNTASAVRRPFTMVMNTEPVEVKAPPAKITKPSLLPPPSGPMVQRPPVIQEPQILMKQNTMQLGHAYPARDRDPEGPPHMCFKCKAPIAIYGKLEPCSHVLCESCAKGSTQCPLCNKKIESVRSVKNIDSMFICSAEGCNRGYFNENSFRDHQRIRKHVNPQYEKQRQLIAARQQHK